MKATLVRTSTSDQGTHGVLVFDGFTCHTLELPWRDNERNISCIPTGHYRCSEVDSPKFGKAYQIHDVPERSHILFHRGNWASEVKGCILLGSARTIMANQEAVLQSKITMDQFHEHLDHRDFDLTIMQQWEWTADRSKAYPLKETD